MSNWISFRNPAALIAVAAMLAVAAIVSLLAARDLNSASDGQATVGALTRASANLELAWYQAMGADALAATGQAPDEAQGFYQGAIDLYNKSEAILSSADIPEIDQVLAGSDQGLAGLDQAFAATLALANSGDIAGATDNHIHVTGSIYNDVDPAVQGLDLVAQAADAKLQSKMDAGATKLRIVSIIGLAFAAFGVAYAGWMIYSRDEEFESAEVFEQEPLDFQEEAA